jgi:hypothetical protein
MVFSCSSTGQNESRIVRFFHCAIEEADVLLDNHTVSIKFRGTVRVSHLKVLKRTWCMKFAGWW